jgi:aminopeptidase-like protein
MLRSRYGDTLADKVGLNVLKHHDPEFREYSFLERGSDERQYCSPGVDLPVVSIMRSKYNEYPEYHTSLDNLDLVTPQGLAGSFEVLQKCITALENNRKYRLTVYGEPQLGRRDLYPTLSTTGSGDIVQDMMNLIAYADGSNDLIDISNNIGVPVWKLYEYVEKLTACGLLKPID